MRTHQTWKWLQKIFCAFWSRCRWKRSCFLLKGQQICGFGRSLHLRRCSTNRSASWPSMQGIRGAFQKAMNWCSQCRRSSRAFCHLSSMCSCRWKDKGFSTQSSRPRWPASPNGSSRTAQALRPEWWPDGETIMEKTNMEKRPLFTQFNFSSTGWHSGGHGFRPKLRRSQLRWRNSKWLRSTPWAHGAWSQEVEGWLNIWKLAAWHLTIRLTARRRACQAMVGPTAFCLCISSRRSSSLGVKFQLPWFPHRTDFKLLKEHVWLHVSRTDMDGIFWPDKIL